MRNWERPMAVVDAFVANEFVSACRDKNKVYKFKCDAGNEYSTYSSFIDSNNNGKFDWQDRQIGSSYSPCGKTHDAKTKDEFYNGFIKRNTLLGFGEVIPVIIWRGENGDNVHCTTNLRMDTWETAKS